MLSEEFDFQLSEALSTGDRSKVQQVFVEFFDTPAEATEFIQELIRTEG